MEVPLPVLLVRFLQLTILQGATAHMLGLF